MKALEEAGDLANVYGEVDPYLELASVTQKSEAEDGPALMFRKVKGYEIPVVAGLLSNMRRTAVALGVSQDKIVFKSMEALEKPIKPVVVKKGSAQENTVNSGIDLMKMFPIPFHAKKDAGHYITAGVIVSKDPETGRRNVAYNRLQVKGPTKLGFCISHWRHVGEFYEKRESKGESLEVAACIGVDPAIELAAGARVPYDEFELASSFRGEPLKLVKCKTVDLEVPADSEIILEGRVLPHVREDEAPFGEFTGYYGKVRKYPILEITSVSYRTNPIYRTIVGASLEHVLLGNVVTREPSLYQTVKRMVPSLKAVHLTPQSGGFHAIISMRQMRQGEARMAMLAAFNSHINIKHVVVVDEDVNIFDPKDVEWAIATRVQGDEDIVMIPKARGMELDPSSDDGMCTKVGVDATRPVDAPPGSFERVSWEIDQIDLKKYMTRPMK